MGSCWTKSKIKRNLPEAIFSQQGFVNEADLKVTNMERAIHTLELSIRNTVQRLTQGPKKASKRAVEAAIYPKVIDLAEKRRKLETLKDEADIERRDLETLEKTSQNLNVDDRRKKVGKMWTLIGGIDVKETVVKEGTNRARIARETHGVIADGQAINADSERMSRRDDGGDAGETIQNMLAGFMNDHLVDAVDELEVPVHPVGLAHSSKLVRQEEEDEEDTEVSTQLLPVTVIETRRPPTAPEEELAKNVRKPKKTKHKNKSEEEEDADDESGDDGGKASTKGRTSRRSMSKKLKDDSKRASAVDDSKDETQ